MLIAYASRTGNVVRFVQKLPFKRCLRIQTGKEMVDEPCVVITYTTGFGEVPKEVLEFAQRNRTHIRGVAASGNRNWGALFARAGVILSQQLGVPLLHQFELAGWEKDVQTFVQAVLCLSAAQHNQPINSTTSTQPQER